MCSDNTKSFLQSKSNDDLTSGLPWDQLYSELSKNAPTLLALLQVCTKTRVARPNTKAVLGMCAAILLKHRQPKMNLLQSIISLILYAGHASEMVIHVLQVLYNYQSVCFDIYLCAFLQVYTRLQKLNLAMSHSSVIRLVEKIGTNHDAAVKEWRDTLLASIHSRNPDAEVIHLIQCVATCLTVLAFNCFPINAGNMPYNPVSIFQLTMYPMTILVPIPSHQMKHVIQILQTAHGLSFHQLHLKMNTLQQTPILNLVMKCWKLMATTQLLTFKMMTSLLPAIVSMH